MNTSDLVPSDLKEKFWVVSADMGYGHQRTVYPLKDLSRNKIILNANTSPCASLKERRLWKEMLKSNEFMSRAGKLPLIGRFLSKTLDSQGQVELYTTGNDPLKR